MEEEEHEVYGGEIPDVADMDADGDINGADVDGSKIQELDEMKKRLKEMEDEANALREVQAIVEKEMGSEQDLGAAAIQANKEEVDSRSVFVGNVQQRPYRNQCKQLHKFLIVEKRNTNHLTS